MYRLYLLFFGLITWVVPRSYAQSDSIRIEISQEKMSTDSTGSSNPERAEREKKLMKDFLRRSRREVTLIELGIGQPINHSGIFVFNDPRPRTEQTQLYSVWAGVEHKIGIPWSVTGGIDWQFSPKTDKANVSGSSWLGQLGLNYYPVIRKAIREGKSANNFYHQLYITGRALLPFHDKLPLNDPNSTGTITANAFRQAAMLGIGTHSTRTRFYFYNVILGVAYLFGPDEGLRSPIQLMGRISLGLGL